MLYLLRFLLIFVMALGLRGCTIELVDRVQQHINFIFKLSRKRTRLSFLLFFCLMCTTPRRYRGPDESEVIIQGQVVNRRVEVSLLYGDWSGANTDASDKTPGRTTALIVKNTN